MRAKKTRIAQRLLNPLLFSGQGKIVVASSGRAGSTMLFDAIKKGWVRHRLGSRADGMFGSYVEESCNDFVARIMDVSGSPAVILKTHDLFTNVPDCKFIFVYGDPLDSAMSVQTMVQREGIEWFFEHQYHLQATGQYADLFNKDVLNFSGQIESWLNAKHANVFVVAYEDLWDRQADLAAFLGFPVSLPAKRERSPKTYPADINAELFERLRGLVGQHQQ